MNEMKGKMKGNLQALFMIFVIVLKQRKVTMGFKQCPMTTHKDACGCSVKMIGDTQMKYGIAQTIAIVFASGRADLN